MFNTIRKIWDEHEFSKEVVQEFIEMVGKSREMLEYAFKILEDRSTGKKYEKKIYGKDQKINIKERAIRKRILVHLATNDASNLSACLVLMSVVKDAERLGDYVKNFFELRKYTGETDDFAEHFTRLHEELGVRTITLFDNVSRAFLDSDKDLALASIEESRALADRCEAIIEEAASNDAGGRLTVITVLGARYLKRIVRHLANIASSVVNPLPEIDFEARTELEVHETEEI